VAAVVALTIPPAAHAQQTRDQVRIVGSSTVFPFATTVAERFGARSPYPAPIIEATGTGGGLQLFCEGVGVNTPDISNASRQITESEVEMCAANGVDSITEFKIGYDGIVMAAAEQTPQLDLTKGELWQALAKTVPQDGELVENPNERWSDIDPSFPDTQIQVFGPPPTSGTRDAFNELVMEEGCMEFEAVQQLDEQRQEEVCAQIREDGAYIEAGENDNLIVQRLQAEPDTYGIFGFSFYDQNRDAIQANMISGVEPTFETIADDSYPVSRSLFFYVKDAHSGVIPGLKEYVDEFISERAIGQEGYLVDKGLIPLPEGEFEQQAQKVAELSG
jgi:phosphate transport system substrate-binding protein